MVLGVPWLSRATLQGSSECCVSDRWRDDSGPNVLDTDTCIRCRVRADETDVGSRYGCCMVTTGSCVSRRNAVVEQDGSCYRKSEGR
jgi:hypothetical protein